MPFKSVLVDNTPCSLQDICLQSLREYLNSANFFLGARDGLSLPTELCERLLQYQILEDRDLDSQFVSIFEDTSCTRLKHVSLKNVSLEEHEAEILFRHELRELELIRMKVIAPKVRRTLNEYSQQLISLTISECDDFFSQPITELLITAPKLRKLVLQSVDVDPSHELFSSLLRGFPNLAYLDLSDCNNVGDLSYLLHCPNLSTLILYNVCGLQGAIDYICKLASLRHLDISQSSDIRGRSNEKNGTYRRPNQTLAMIVESLPFLKCLDISGTNLAGTGVAEKTPAGTSGNLATDIPGLRSRICNPLDYLGLYGTSHEACHRHHIPALCVTGDATEEQILAAGKVQ